MQITVSTVGLVPEMRQFAAESRAVMAVSLHATTDEVRRGVLPVAWQLCAAVHCVVYGAQGSGCGACIWPPMFSSGHPASAPAVANFLSCPLQVRDRIVPVNKRWPLAELIATMEVSERHSVTAHAALWACAVLKGSTLAS